MKRSFLVGLLIMVTIALILGGCTSQPSPTASQPIKIGAIVPFTGNAADEEPCIQRGIEFALSAVNSQVAGRQIVVQIEDETEDPTIAVAKAKKLVEQDKVDVILGPLLSHTAVAVQQYLAPLKVPNLSAAPADVTSSSDSFFSQGTSRGDTYPSGLYAYDDLGARKAVIIYQDYLYGEQIRDGFKAAFTSRGGTIVSEIKVPLGTADMAPYMQAIGNADVIEVLLVAPSDVGFIKQYKQYGLKMPAIFGQILPQGEIYKLKQMGDDLIGFYGFGPYSPLIDTTVNKQFVDQFNAKYGLWPGCTTMMGGYLPTSLFLSAVKATNGDTSHDKIINAISSISNFQAPLGTFNWKNRIGVVDEYAFKAVKVGNQINWQVIKKYSGVSPM